MRRSRTCVQSFLFGFLVLFSISWIDQELGQSEQFLVATTLEEQSTRDNPSTTNSPTENVLSSTHPHVNNTSSTKTTTNSSTISTTPSSPTPQQTEPRNLPLPRQATIVVQLSGEMANNLHHIAHGVGLQLLAKEEFDIDCNIVLRHYEGPNNRSPKPKWKSARDNLQSCFPSLAPWNFNEGNGKDFGSKQALQRAWLGGRMDHLFGLINANDLSTVRRGLELLAKELLNDPHRPPPPDENQASRIRVPFLYSETLDVFPMIDRYYDQIRNLMNFNDSSCCAQVPNVNDSVFHFRNYESEMPERRAYDMGFAELSPTKVAHEVFGTLPTGDHVAITTRIVNQKAKNYVVALYERGINATITTDQSTVQDFCFLKQAHKQVVGSARSTFVFWAGLLGQAQVIRLYHVDNAGLRLRHPDYWQRFTYNFTHPKLKDRLRFELYQEEDIHPG